MLSSLPSRKVAARLRTVAAAALAVVTLTAATCGDDDEDFGVVGTYELTGVATAQAPGIFVDPQGTTFSCGNNLTCEFQSGSITLNESGNTFSLSVQGLQRPSNQTSGGTQVSFVTTGVQTGTWAQSGSTITFTPSASGVGTFTGTLSDGNAQLRVDVPLASGADYILRFEQ